MCGDEEEEKRSHDEFPLLERKIGGDGKMEREKKKKRGREGEKNFPPHVQMHLRARRRGRGGRKVSFVSSL